MTGWLVNKTLLPSDQEHGDWQAGNMGAQLTSAHLQTGRSEAHSVTTFHRAAHMYPRGLHSRPYQLLSMFAMWLQSPSTLHTGNTGGSGQPHTGLVPGCRRWPQARIACVCRDQERNQIPASLEYGRFRPLDAAVLDSPLLSEDTPAGSQRHQLASFLVQTSPCLQHVDFHGTSQLLPQDPPPQAPHVSMVLVHAAAEVEGVRLLSSTVSAGNTVAAIQSVLTSSPWLTAPPSLVLSYATIRLLAGVARPLLVTPTCATWAELGPCSMKITPKSLHHPDLYHTGCRDLPPQLDQEPMVSLSAAACCNCRSSRSKPMLPIRRQHAIIPV
jgi:hypothetical protein